MKRSYHVDEIHRSYFELAEVETKKKENLVGRWEKEAGTGSVGVAAEADVGVPGVSPGHFRSSAR